LAKKHNLPEKDMLLYGSSRGAHWSQRLGVRFPERFLAVHIHIANTFENPTEKNRGSLWLISTGAIDVGQSASFRFARQCWSLGVPAIVKTYRGLGHTENPETGKLGVAFFQYALDVRKRQMEVAEQGARPIPDVAVEDFAKAPYFGDYLNQIVFPREKAKKRVPAEQLVPLPTEELAIAWGGKIR